MWQQQTKTELMHSCYQAKTSTYAANTRWHSRLYLFRYSLERTVSMTVRELLRVRGAKVVTQVFSNLTAEDIRDSVDAFEKAIDQAQIIMFPVDSALVMNRMVSAKFFATAFQNAKIKEAVKKLLKRDELVLGICNGFQALIKLGLVPYGEILGQTEDSRH